MRFDVMFKATCEYSFILGSRKILPYRVQKAIIQHYSLVKFRNLIKFAFEYSPFYKELYRSAGISEKDIQHLQFKDIPIVKKEDIQNNLEYVFTDRQIRSEDLFKFIANKSHKDVIFNKNYYCFGTSGSLGNKLPVLYTKKDWQTLNTLMCLKSFEIPSLTKKLKIAALLLTDSPNAGITTLRSLPSRFFDLKEISLLKPIDEIVKELNDFQPDRIAGYPEVFSRLIKYRESDVLKVSPQKIILGGEILSDSTHQKIEKVFNATVMNNYGSSECVVIGTKERPYESFTHHPTLSQIEILNDENEPVANGETGKVVVTNFFNHAQPFIRYEVGDKVVASQNPNGEVVISKFLTRNYKPVYFFTNEGKKLYFHPSVLYEWTAKTPEIEKSQISISHKKIHVNIKGSEKALESIRSLLKKFIEDNNIAQNTEIYVNLVSDIEPELNGKVPFIKYL